MTAASLECFGMMNDTSFLEEDEDDDDNDDTEETQEENVDEKSDDYKTVDDDSVMKRLLFQRPIVVGYSFGPKKMSTMGVVMAEASKTRFNTNMFQSLWEQHSNIIDDNTKTLNHHPKNETLHQQQQQQQHSPSSPTTNNNNNNTNLMLTEEALSSFRYTSPTPEKHLFSTSSLTTRNHHHHHNYYKKNKTTTNNSVVFSMDQQYLNPQHNPQVPNSHSTIVRHFDSSPHSDSSWGSTGTRTASTATSFRTLSAGGTGSMAGNTYAQTTDSSNSRPTGSFNPTIRVSFVPLDPEIPLQEQHGGMDVILHKLTEDILLLSQLSFQYKSLQTILQSPDEAAMENVLAQHPLLSESDAAAIRRVCRLCQFQKQHGCYLVDDPASVLILMSRADIARVLQDCLSTVTSLSGIPVHSPKYTVYGDIPSSSHLTHFSKSIQKVVQDAQLSFPIIVKPLMAAGTKASHAMAVVTHPCGLDQIATRFPCCLLQEYANHNGILYKVYVLGDFVSVHKRRSLPNLPSNTAASPPVVEFDSQRPYPRLSDFGYPQQQQPQQQQQSFLENVSSDIKSDWLVTADEVRPIAEALKRAFGLEIFGFDILITNEKIWMVVDVNYFPSYKEVPNFPALLAKYLTGRAIASRLDKGRLSAKYSSSNT